MISEFDFIGTCKSVHQIAEEEGLEIEEFLSENNVELCPHCEWWCETSELVDDEGEMVGCIDCRD